MLVANTFDLWQKDVFFAAAEEVQASTDIMESAYRTWVRQKREGLSSIHLDELCRELQTALGTAKWQLDEFQRAIRTSYRNRVDEVIITRHEQFVSAMESQISRVEEELKQYFKSEIKKPLRWVNLDQQERDDLAMFLSGVPESSDNNNKDLVRKDNLKHDYYTTSCDDFHNDACFVQVDPVEVLGTSDASSCEKKAGSRRIKGSKDAGALKITVDDQDDDDKKPLMLNIESISKDKGSLWKLGCGNYWINQIFKRAAGSQRHLQTSIHLQRSCSYRLMLVLMLAIFLLVPFVMYSN